MESIKTEIAVKIAENHYFVADVSTEENVEINITFKNGKTESYYPYNYQTVYGFYRLLTSEDDYDYSDDDDFELNMAHEIIKTLLK